MLLDPIEDVHAHPAVHHVDGQSSLPKSTRAPNPVQVGLVVGVTVFVDRQIKIDYHWNLFDINALVKAKQGKAMVRQEVTKNIQS